MARKKRPVWCVETGQVFDSRQEAAEWAGCSPNSIAQVLYGYAPTAGGYRWEFVLEDSARHQNRPRTAPRMTIYEVQAEAERRTKKQGRRIRYADIQKEETLLMLRRQAAREKLKRRAQG